MDVLLQEQTLFISAMQRFQFEMTCELGILLGEDDREQIRRY